MPTFYHINMYLAEDGINILDHHMRIMPADAPVDWQHDTIKAAFEKAVFPNGKHNPIDIVEARRWWTRAERIGQYVIADIIMPTDNYLNGKWPETVKQGILEKLPYVDAARAKIQRNWINKLQQYFDKIIRNSAIGLFGACILLKHVLSAENTVG